MDLDESLIDANSDALDIAMDEFDFREADEVPGWADEAVAIERRPFVEPQS